MNNADIEAARRLIAQFEGTALGRHNSSTWRENPVAPEESTYPTQARGRWIPEQHRMVTLRDGPQDCRVGEYCFMVGRVIPDDLAIFRFIPPVNLKRFVEFNDTPSPEFDVWEFERVWLVDRRWPERRRMAWHRIA